MHQIGSISKRGFSISINQKDIKILEFIRQEILPVLNIRKFTRIQISGKLSNMCEIVINSQQISKDLCGHLKIKPGKKSHTVQFPDIDEKLKWFFIRGYFEGDGTINDPELKCRHSNQACIKSNSENMLKSLKYHCGSGNIYKNNIEWNSKKDFLEFCENIYKDGNMKLQRKFDKYQKWIKYYEQKELIDRISKIVRQLINEIFFNRKVK